MTPLDLADLDCSVARTLDVVGDKWTLLILRDALYGLRRFDEFRDELGIARNVLADRLRRLVEQGVFDKRPYSRRPLRHEYRLTEKGRDLLPVILAMMRWGDRWAGDASPPPVVIRHHCGEDATAGPLCSGCGRPLLLHELRADPIPERIAAILRARGSLEAAGA